MFAKASSFFPLFPYKALFCCLLIFLVHCFGIYDWCKIKKVAVLDYIDFS